MGLVQMKKIEIGIKRRTAISKYYTLEFQRRSARGIITPYVAKNRTHVFHLYTVRVQKEKSGIIRNDLFKRLSKAGVQSSVLYTPLHLMSYYKQFLNKDQSAFPVAQKVYDEILSLPIYPTMTKKERIAVATSVLKSLLSET